MKRSWKMGIVVALVVSVAAIIGLRQSGVVSCPFRGGGTASAKQSRPSPKSDPQSVAGTGLPKLVDIGSTSCIPCLMMAPILENLKKEYAGRMEVEVIDANKDREAAARYGIKLIPTQVFFDASGKERFRHEGFMAREDILAKWKELGVNLTAAPPSAEPSSSAPAFERSEAAQAPAAGTTPDAKPVLPAMMEEAYPGLASGVLRYARVADLPEGILLEAPGVTISQKELAAETAGAPAELRSQLEKNAFFVLESVGTPKLLLAVAKQEAARQARNLEGKTEAEIIQAHLANIVVGLSVTDEELSAFYAGNKDMFGEASLAQVKAELKQYLLQQKQNERIQSYVETLGQTVPIKVSAAWVRDKSVLAKDNVVDKARASGKPSLVDFGSKGCVPCDMLAPILETLKTKHAGKANVLFVSVQEEQMLAARYRVASIPAQVLFDKNGAEVFRHVGFWPQDEIEKKLAEIGVK